MCDGRASLVVGINANGLKTRSRRSPRPVRWLCRCGRGACFTPEMVRCLAAIPYVLHALTPAHESIRPFVWTESSPKRRGLAASRYSINRSLGEETGEDKRHMTRASPSRGAEVGRGCFGSRLWVFLNEASKQRR